MAQTRIVTLVGSLREASINRQLAELAAEVAPEGVIVTVYEGLAEIPFYNEDLDTETPPAAASALRAAAAQADGALFVTPEYNGTIPAVLKNAIDWLSRPWGASDLEDKPVAVIGSAMGRYGGAWAHDETRKSLGIAGPRVVESITFSLPAKTLEGEHPRDNPHVVAAVRDAVGTLAAEASPGTP
ncbi:MAG: NAD(P)H-dependent oxidoreductase [Actinobacteria bacterium]|nr:NAD(P)H-dependent oxidoreductase [Actinomycetota bacterium]